MGVMGLMLVGGSIRRNGVRLLAILIFFGLFGIL